MKPNTNLTALSYVLSVVFTSAACAADQPNPDQILRQMSDKLSAARSFTFTAHREVDPALLEGTAVADDARIEARVLRPNKLAAHASTNLGKRDFYADGRTLTVLDGRANTYATVPMRTSIDGTVAALDGKYGFTPPLADFAVSNPYRALREQAQRVSYVGREKVAAGFLGLGGVECHHLALRAESRTQNSGSRSAINSRANWSRPFINPATRRCGSTSHRGTSPRRSAKATSLSRRQRVRKRSRSGPRRRWLLPARKSQPGKLTN